MIKDFQQGALFDLPDVAEHPAPFNRGLLQVLAELLAGSQRVLDPFAGTGRIFELAPMLPDTEIDAVEIEPKWVNLHPKTRLGSALDLPFADDVFDAICTSPTYGNRMADHHEAKDASRRNTYRHKYGEPLHPDNSGLLQWGERYRAFHLRAWTEAWRVLRPGGRFVLNIKDHIRGGERQYVTAWHVSTLEALGFKLVQHRRVQCPGQRFGANRDRRIAYESVILFCLIPGEGAFVDGMRPTRASSADIAEWPAAMARDVDLG